MRPDVYCSHQKIQAHHALSACLPPTFLNLYVLFVQLARHEASKIKPGSMEAKSRKPDVQYAKK